MSKIKGMSAGAVFTVLVLLLGIEACGQPSMSIDTATGRIMIRAERRQIQEVEGAIAEFPLETRQIQIKARFLKLSEDAMREFGIHLERLAGVKVPLGEAGEGTSIVLGEGAFQYTFYRLKVGEEKLEAIVDALIITGEAELLSEPQVSTLSGQVAGIYAVGKVPYKVSEAVTTETTTIPEKWEYATVGIVLQVLPEIVGKDLVQTSIVLVAADYEIKPEFGPTHPVFYSDISPTNITVRSGEPIVIGGLMREEKTETVAGLPILSQLPIIGNLFKTRVETKSKTNLVVTVEPHIITPREIRGRTKKVFVFKYALAEEMADRVREILSNEGMVEMNPREAPPNSILVRDNEDKTEDIQTLLGEIGTFEQQRREETFELSYSTPEQIRKAVSTSLSSKGSVRIDEEANSVTIEDG
ncbi:type II and III secretion system protein, partial [Candidatus Aerophobetes bacterium]